MKEHNTPERFRCYTSEYAVELVNHTAAKRIKWKTPYTLLHGKTPDIPVFRFSFFESIFYLNPHATFPQPNMLPGRFLDIARTTGNSFTFIIAQDTSKTGKILHRSIIQKRNIKETNPYTNYTILPVITPQVHMETSDQILPETYEELQPSNKHRILQDIEGKEEDNCTGETILDDNLIIHHGTFEFLEPDSDIPEGYQLAPLRMIFDVKSDLRRKARLVVGGHKVNASEYTKYSSVVRFDSTRLLNVIAKAQGQGLNILVGDVGNAYLNACTKEKVYCVCSPECSPELEGGLAIIKKALYRLKSSGAQWYAHFATTLYSMGFIPTRIDPNIWIKRRCDGQGYDYISAYADDFLITAKEPKKYMDQLQEVYTIKNQTEPNDYLGTTYIGGPRTK